MRRTTILFPLAGALLAGACVMPNPNPLPTPTTASTTSTTAASTTTGPTTSTPTSTSTSTPTSTTSTPTTTEAAGGVDTHHLPLGDGKYTTTATRGSIYSCPTTFGGGGASATGSWFNGDGTWDLSKKPTVDGSVTWPHSFTMAVNGSTRTFTGNDLPDHETGNYPISPSDDAYAFDRNPNSIAAQTISFSVPANPVVKATPSCEGGEVGILVSGTMVFNGFDAGGRDAVAHEIQDECHGHPQRTGVYHYHDVSSCVPDPGTGHSNLLGYALDGFGIYGNRGENGEALTNADLDECHGHTHTITWNGQQVSMYHYHATAEFPYTVGCFRGTPTHVVTGG